MSRQNPSKMKSLRIRVSEGEIAAGSHLGFEGGTQVHLYGDSDNNLVEIEVDNFISAVILELDEEE